MFSAFLFPRTRSPAPLPMHDRNDIKFKGSLGSPPEIKWQPLLWGRGTLSLMLTLSLCCSFASKQQLPFEEILSLLVGGGRMGPRTSVVSHSVTRGDTAPSLHQLPDLHCGQLSGVLIINSFPEVQSHLPLKGAPMPQSISSWEDHPSHGDKGSLESSFVK